ncbi:MAG: FKBP-type peptidyl-prolyl cis-trans isomerase [Melioribacteraceae bacterium]|nr:FKBP-type peptidyl-prolyl cis-trans isomerase [Melioribacteraceae bacterium]
MRLLTIIFVFGFLINTAAQDKVQLKTEKDKFSYSLGYELGNNMHAQEMDLNVEALVKGLTNGLEANPELMNPDEMTELIIKVQSEMIQKREAEKRVVADRNKKEGETFLAKNRTKEGIIETESGLQYRVIKEGTGKPIGDSENVKIHYRGYFLDGGEFDNSYKRGEPYDFDVTGVITGWKEALKLMKEGDKWQLFIPYHLAYGEQGGRGMEPCKMLLFDIEIISIVK